MSNKRAGYIQVRLTQEERGVIDAVAQHMRRSRSDTLRILALDKAEALGLIHPQSSPLQNEMDEKATSRAVELLV